MNYSHFIKHEFNDHLKLWVYSKVRDLFKTDPYFGHVDRDILLSNLSLALFQSNNLSDLLKAVDGDYKKGIKISRKIKKDGVLYFEYPSLNFQIRSLFELWSKVVSLYETNEWLNKEPIRFSFGHKPAVVEDSGDTSSLPDKFINSPLKIKFQDEYTAFQKFVYDKSNKLVSVGSSPDTKVFVIQTDIKAFFHSLYLKDISSYLDKKLKINFFKKYLEELEVEFEFSGGLPIGWMFSGFIADILIQGFHAEVLSSFNSVFLKKLSKDLTSQLKKILPETKVTEELSKYVLAKMGVSNFKFEFASNYVDDFVFVISSTDVPVEGEDESKRKIFERIVADAVFEVADELIAKEYGKDNLHFYNLEEGKGKYFTFNQNNIDSLKTNFHRFMGIHTYDEEIEPNLWAMLDDFLLPADNDLSLNERAQFFATLSNLRKMLIEGEKISKEDRDDIFKKILFKIESDEAKYIHSIFSLIEAFLASDEQGVDYYLEKVSSIIEKFIAANKSLDLWLKLFKGYNFLHSRRKYDKRINFFNDFNKFYQHWKSRSNNLDDFDIIESVLSSYIIKEHVYLRTTDVKFTQSGALPSLSVSGNISSYFDFFLKNKNRLERFNLIRKSDVISLAHITKRLVHKRSDLNVRQYSLIHRNIKRHFGRDYSDLFFRLTAYEYLPKLDDKERMALFKSLNNKRVLLKTTNNKAIQLLNFSKKMRKSFGPSYETKLTFIRKMTNTKRLPNTPLELGGASWKNPQSVAFLISCIDQNYSFDMDKRYLFTLQGMFASRLVDYMTIPIGLKSSGLLSIDCLKLLSEWPVDSRGKLKSYQGFIKEIHGIVEKEVVQYRKTETLSRFKSELVTCIDVDKLLAQYDGPNRASTVSKAMRMTVAPVGYEWSIYDKGNGCQFKPGMHEILDYKIQAAIIEAKNQSTQVLVFPELCLPRRYLHNYLDLCSKYGIILIAGLEYQRVGPDKVVNSTVISFPLDRNKNPYGRSYLAFEQVKHYPAAEEKAFLRECNVDYLPGKNLFIFDSKRIGNFSVLTCSDFLSMQLRLKLQQNIQTLFVPAQNIDNTSYDHIAETCIRDLHCFAVICNNQTKGSSFVYAPLYDRRRRVFLKVDGKISPEFATVDISPTKLLISQSADSQIPFRKKEEEKRGKKKGEYELADFKQTPPDWKK